MVNAKFFCWADPGFLLDGHIQRAPHVKALVLVKENVQTFFGKSNIGSLGNHYLGACKSVLSASFALSI